MFGPYLEVADSCPLMGALTSVLPRVRRFWVVGGVVLLAILGAWVWWRAGDLRQAALYEWRVELEARADATRLAASQWLEGLRGDVRLAAAYMATVPGVFAASASPRRAVASYLSLRQEVRTYAGAWLLDPRDRVLVHSARAARLDPARLARIAQSVRHGEDNDPGPWWTEDSTLVAVFAAPVTAAAPPGGLARRVLGTVVVAVDPRQDLYPLVYAERVPTRSAAANLVAHVGDEYVVLSEPSVPREGPLAPRRPWTQASEVGKLAIAGVETFDGFTDYRGVRVLAATRRIPGTGWGLVRKVDEDEALGPYRRQFRIELSLLAAGVGLLAAMVFAYARTQEAERLEIVARSAAEVRASEEQLRRLAQRLESVREEEQTRIAREIHDQLGQALTALKLDLTWLQRKLTGERHLLSEKADPLLTLVDATIEAGRQISAELRPPILEDLGLAAAIEWSLQRFGEQTGIRYGLQANEDNVPLEAGRALYRILQEALTNVAGHAAARRVDVRLGRADGGLVLEVRDDGKGISDEVLHDTRSLGLVGMRERAMALGGTVTFSRSPGGGTMVTVRLPREHASAEAV